MIENAWLIPLFPILGFIIISFIGSRIKEGGAPIAIISVLFSFILSILVLVEVIFHNRTGEYSYTWLTVGSAEFEVGVLVDSLTALMILIVSFVGLLVVIYSVGYMHDEEGLPRYYAEITLFIGVMLGLVLANNFILLYIFWELVGLCSYLLIGFWYKKPEAASAAKKAFIVTRVGDIFLLFGIAIIFIEFGTLNFRELSSIAGGADVHLLTTCTLLIFGGAVGKSAQFPLHVWLPDAMEGPTTVSALIHAATMVKAGVYLVARAYPLIVHTPVSALVIAIIGAVTAFIAASIALVQYDIKRVLAYSTISQLGYMMLALGAGAYYFSYSGTELESTKGYTAGLFHLMNHAFFKALLFLCAGSVIHAVGSNDMRQMGGLHKKMKITSVTMLIGALSISGIPGFSGFFSKDEVLTTVYETGDIHSMFYILFAIGIITAFLTAFYMFRMWFLTFGGKRRTTKKIHESPKVMTVPLMILAFLGIFSGYSLFIGYKGTFADFMKYPAEGIIEISIVHILTTPLTYISIIIAVLGIFIAYKVYLLRKPEPTVFTATKPRYILHHMLVKKYWMDDAYIGFAERIVYGFSKILDFFDRHVIDGMVNDVSWITVRLGRASRRIQTGFVQYYALVVVGGICALLIFLFFWWGVV